MIPNHKRWLIGVALALLFISVAGVALAAPSSKKKHNLPKAQHGGTVIGLCDGETSVEIDGAMDRDKAQAASAELMSEWRKKHPEASWDNVVAENGPARPTGAAAQAQSGAPTGNLPPTQHDV